MKTKITSHFVARSLVLIGLVSAMFATQPPTMTHAQSAPPPFTTDCFDYVPLDASLFVKRTVFQVQDSISPNGGYGQNGQRSCADFWHVGVYNDLLKQRLVVRPWWGNTPPATRDECLLSAIEYFVWGKRSLTTRYFENLGGGILMGVWNGRSCEWKGDNPYTSVIETVPEQIVVEKNTQVYLRVAAQAVRMHAPAPCGISCLQSVRVRLYSYP